MMLHARQAGCPDACRWSGTAPGRAGSDCCRRSCRQDRLDRRLRPHRHPHCQTLPGDGNDVLVYDPYKPPAEIKAAGCEPVADLDAALPRADFVSIHCPKTPETVGMFNAARLRRMKPSRLSDQYRARRDRRREGAVRRAGLRQARRRRPRCVRRRSRPPSGQSLLEAAQRHHVAAHGGRDARGRRSHERADRAQHSERARRRTDPTERHQSGCAWLILKRKRLRHCRQTIRGGRHRN